MYIGRLILASLCLVSLVGHGRILRAPLFQELVASNGGCVRC